MNDIPGHSNRNNRTILALLGKRGSGKTSLAKHLQLRLNFKHVEMSEHLNQLKSETAHKGMRLRKFVEFIHGMKSKDYFIRIIYNKHIFNTEENFVLTGIRHQEELLYLESILKHCDFKAVYLQVNFLERARRTINREQRSSIVDFLVEDYYSNKWGDKKLKAVSSVLKSSGNISKTFSELVSRLQ